MAEEMMVNCDRRLLLLFTVDANQKVFVFQNHVYGEMVEMVDRYSVDTYRNMAGGDRIGKVHETPWFRRHLST